MIFKGVKRNVDKGFRTSSMCTKLWFSNHMCIVGIIHNF